MAAYRIEFTDDAHEDLLYFKAFERKIIVDDIKAQLTPQPRVATRNRKQLREHPMARWELRTGKFRTFYAVSDEPVAVRIVAVGEKNRNELFIRGRKVEL